MEFLIFFLLVFGFTLLGAVTQNPVTGRTKNKYGPAVFSKWKNLNTMRTKPVQVANPNTVPQQNARQKLSFMSKIARDLGTWLDFGFDSFYSTMTRRNAYVKTNYENVIAEDGEVTEFDFNAASARTGRTPQTGETIQIAATVANCQVDTPADYPPEYDQGFLDVVGYNVEAMEICLVGTVPNPEPDESYVLTWLPGKTPTLGDGLRFQYSWRNATGTEVDSAQPLSGEIL